MRSDLIAVSTDELFEQSCKYMDYKCGLQKQRRGIEKLKAKTQKIWFDQFAGRTVQILTSSFGRECVRKDCFVFGTDVLHCDALSQIEPDTVQGGYLFLFHAPDQCAERQPTLDSYLEDCWQTAVMDAGRDWLANYFRKTAQKEYAPDISVTHTFGPGFYGMGIEETSVFFKLLDYEKLGMKLLGSGMMLPEKSFVGLVLVLTGKNPLQPADCANCRGDCKGCRMCKSTLKTN